MKQTQSRSRLFRFIIMGMFVGMLMPLLSGWMGVQAAPATPADDDWPEWRGTVESMPASGFTGSWTIGGRTFEADASTQIDQEHGALAVGVCAEVKYQTVGSSTGSTYRAMEIQSTESYKCGNTGGNNGGENGGENGGNNGEQHNKVYGRIDSMPAGGLVGDWVIDGTTYTADANTYFEQEHGGFAVGACVEVDFQTGTPPLATKIGTDNDYKCSGTGNNNGGNNGGENQYHGEMYGVIETMPASGLVGDWVIGGMTFTADAATRFEQEHAAFAPGVMVEVKFYTDASNVNHATKIESKYATDSSGHDDDGNGSYEGHEGHAYAIVDSMPAGGTTGTWSIGGIDYIVNSATRIEQEHGAIAVGSNVKVKYYLDASGNRVAMKIESTNENGGATDPSHFKLYGFVEQMPAGGGFNGQWVINGVTFTADQTTMFKEDDGLLAVGAYVEVEYTQSGGSNWITKIETNVPPGAGTSDHYGQIENVSGAGAASTSAVTATWTVGGVNYTVTPATDLNDLNGALTLGSTALVNSYTDAAGNQVATQIRGIALINHIYLPVAIR